MSNPRADTWMPFYVGDYLRDTGRLSTEGHGAYLLLILDYWTAGELPDDDEQLSAVTRMPLKAWKKMRPTLERFFTVADGKWVHKRIEKELARAADKSKKRAEAGRNGAAKRWPDDNKSGGKPIANATPAPSENASQTDGYARTLQSQSQKDTASSEAAPLTPLELDKEFWRTAIAYLGEKRRSLIGKWRSEHGNEAVMRALARAQAENPADPIEFITGCLRTSNGRKQPRPDVWGAAASILDSLGGDDPNPARPLLPARRSA